MFENIEFHGRNETQWRSNFCNFRLTDNVESVLIGNGLTNPSGAIVLPNATVLVTDLQQGVLVFDFGGNVVNRITSEMWKNPRSPVYHKEQIFVSLH